MEKGGERASILQTEKTFNLITKLQIAFEIKALAILTKPDLKRRVYPLVCEVSKVKDCTPSKSLSNSFLHILKNILTTPYIIW